jgi:hypothetical protein
MQTPNRDVLANLGGGVIGVTRGTTYVPFDYLEYMHPHGWYDAALGKLPISKEEGEIHNATLSQVQIDALDRFEIGDKTKFYYAPPDTLVTYVGEQVTQAALVKVGILTFERNGRKFQGKLVNRDQDIVEVVRIE